MLHEICCVTCVRNEKNAAAFAKAAATLQEAEQNPWAAHMIPVRSAGQKWARLRLQQLHGGRSHPRLRAACALRGRAKLLLHAEDRDVIIALVEDTHRTYIDAVSELESKGKRAAAWRAESLASSIAELFAAASEASSAFDSMNAAVNTMDECKKQGLKEAASGVRKHAATLRERTRPFLQHGFPPVWANKLNDLGLTSEEDADKYETSDGSCAVASVDDWTAPHWWTLDDAKPGLLECVCMSATPRSECCGISCVMCIRAIDQHPCVLVFHVFVAVFFLACRIRWGSAEVNYDSADRGQS